MLLLLQPTKSVLKQREVQSTVSSFYVSVLYTAMLRTSIAAVALRCFYFCLLDCDASGVVVDCAAVKTRCMLEKYTWALSVVARRKIELASWRPRAVDCTVWNERYRTRLACHRPGAGAHRDIERTKVPSAARVACIARSACTSPDQNSHN